MAHGVLFSFGRYKCPKCRSPFCCVQCSKEHKANKCPATSNNNTTETADVAASTKGNAAPTNEHQSKYLSREELTSNQPQRKRIRRAASGDESDSDDEPGWNITPEMKKLVRQSTWLRKELQDGGLRQLIERIDAASDDEGEDACNISSSSGKMRQCNNTTANNTTISARELALARTKHSHPKFASFVDRMLLTTGVLQPAEERGGGGGIVSSSTLEGHGPLVLAPVPRRSGAMDGNDQKIGSESSGSDDDDSDSDEDSDGSDGDDDSEDSEGTSGANG